MDFTLRRTDCILNRITPSTVGSRVACLQTVLFDTYVYMKNNQVCLQASNRVTIDQVIEYI